MGQLAIARTIAAPPDRVFAAFAELEQAPQRVRGISKLELLTPGPVGSGTRFRETRKIMGMTATEEMAVADFDPPRGYSVVCSSRGTNYLATYRFPADNAGTKVELAFSWTPVTFLARALNVFSGMTIGPLRKCLEEDLDDMKKYLEGTAA